MAEAGARYHIALKRILQIKLLPVVVQVDGGGLIAHRHPLEAKVAVLLHYFVVVCLRLGRRVMLVAQDGAVVHDPLLPRPPQLAFFLLGLLGLLLLILVVYGCPLLCTLS